MKRKKKGDLGSLDSLLDTMTSVVGILIIILVVLQLGAQEAVQRIQSDPNQSPAIKEVSDQLEQKHKELAAMLNDRIRLSAEKQQLITKIGGVPTAALKQEKLKLVESLQPKPSNPKLAKELAGLKEQNAKLMASSEVMDSKLQELDKKLSSASDKPAKPVARNLRLPDPKEPKPGSKGYRFICTGGKVLPIDYTLWDGRVKAALSKSGLKKNSAGEVLDSKALVEYFQKNPLNDALYTLKPVHSAKGKLLYFHFTPKGNIGDLPENLSKPQSHFQKFLAKMNPKQSHVLFTVFPDSFDAYLEARKVLAEKGIPAGWSPSGPQPFVWQHHFHVTTNGRSKLPKPKPTKQPSVAKADLD